MSGIDKELTSALKTALSNVGLAVSSGPPPTASSTEIASLFANWSAIVFVGIKPIAQ